MTQITYDRHSLIIDGRREFIRSAAMHYFRLPSQDLWWDRLQKVKVAGYNTVDLYFCWSYHSPEPGKYNFDGIRDVTALMDMVNRLGLYLIARPGPYINAEYTAGGLPGWLVAMDDVILRNRLPDGSFKWCDKYMGYVQEWWDAVVPKIQAMPNLILMQIENEYGTLEAEPDYIQALYKMTRNHGVTVPLFHNDLYAAGLYEDLVDIYAFDNYSVTSFESNWRENTGVFSVLDHIEDSFRPFCQDRPLFVAELQAGWFGTWHGHSYDHITEHMGREHIAVSTKSLIGQGLTLYNHYKGVGGINWGYIGSTDTYTSYDFAAPISEAGLNTERLYEAKALNQFLATFDLSATDRVTDHGLKLSDPSVLYTVRKPIESHGQWVFLRNLDDTLKSLDWSIQDHTLPLTVHSHECLILPHQIPLKSGFNIVGSSVEPIVQHDHVVIFRANRPVQVILENVNGEASVSQATIDIDLDKTENTLVIQCQALDPSDEAFIQVGEVTLGLLGENRVDHLWHEPGNHLVIGPEMAYGFGNYGVASPKSTPTIVDPNGALSRAKSLKTLPAHPLPELSHWHVENVSLILDRHGASSIKDDGFKPVSKKGPDLDANGIYEGSVWYKLKLPKGAQSITIDAHHIWGAFVDGQYLGNGYHWIDDNDIHPSKPTTLPIDPKLASGGNHELLVFVDGLGHPKGFHDDTQTPQGILFLQVDDRDLSDQLLISNEWANLSSNDIPKEGVPLARISTTFQLDFEETLDCPVGLMINDLPVERVNIYLNGFLIGRHWRRCEAQTLYYLPQGILKTGPDTTNHLSLILMNFDPLITQDYALPKGKQVFLQPYGMFTKIKP